MASVTRHPAIKNSLSVIVGLCVVVLAAIPLTVSAGHLSWLRWQIITWMAVVIALLALCAQAIMQSREDRHRDEREGERDRAIQGIQESVEKLMKSPPMPTALIAEPAKLTAEQKPDIVFDGELQRIFMYPRLGMVPYKMLQEIYQISGRTADPKVDCDILVAMYIVNASTSVQYIRDITASVEVDGKREMLDRRNDFRVKFEDDDRTDDKLEYGFESETGRDNPQPLKPLLPPLPCELPPNKPLEGWVRYVLKSVVPDKIDSNTWQFAIIDSLGNQHFLTKTADIPKVGEIGFRRASQ
jgi:hypothetical protein